MSCCRKRSAWLAVLLLIPILASTAANALAGTLVEGAIEGVPVRFELSEVHMHHKFMLADDVLVTGSYNWTRSASRANFENIVVLGERRLVERFEAEFERLWRMWV